MEMEKPAKERMKAPEEETVHIKAHHSVSSGHSRQQGKSSVLRRAGGCISGSIHNFFYGLGSLVARRPWASILACVLVTVICGAVSGPASISIPSL